MRRDLLTGTPRHRCTSVCRRHRERRRPNFRGCRSWGIRCLRLFGHESQPSYRHCEDDGKTTLTSRYQHSTIAHDISHDLSPITPPTRHRRHIPVQMPLPFILYIERKDILVQILPLGRALDQLIRMLQHMRDTVIKVRHAGGVGVPGRYIVVAGFSDGAVEGWQGVFADVGVVSPAAELVAIVEGDC
jgi:hypothetical protein